MDNVVRTTKSFSALSAKRNTADSPVFHEEIVAIILLRIPDKSSELTLMFRPVR